jgi:putative colanic acid biosynthesis acetyltransferase WcaF
MKETFIGKNFSIENRIRRLLWGIVNFLFFKYSPRPFHSWRSLILRLVGAKVGKGVHVYPRVKIWAPWNLIIGDYSGIANGAILYSQDMIIIGKRVVISQGVHLCSGTHDYTKYDFPLITKPILIGDNVWIASEAFVHPGVKIGEGAVIGARSVVGKDMPSWMVSTGNPCKPIKVRIFDNK